MNYLDAIKSVSSLIVSVGAGAVVGNAIKTNTPLDTKPITKACIVVGGIVLSNMVGHAASKYATDSIDSAVEEIHKVAEQVNNANPKKDN